ncbi:cell wall-binding repeat-containing protein [Planococcus sp. YIM B11945]|uniref:cell wall-binding repeat-containing protein n=1 Tax=Planococcus sp. YIM B11945 TaxID=3435410 RepID=UPI003D7E3956
MKLSKCLLVLLLAASVAGPTSAKADSVKFPQENNPVMNESLTLGLYSNEFTNWPINQLLSITDDKAAVHTLTPKQLVKSGSGLSLKMLYAPAAKNRPDLLLYMEFFLEDERGHLVFDTYAMYSETAATTIGMEFDKRYVDQEFIFVRMGILENFEDEEPSGITFKKIRNPYFQGIKRPIKTDTVLMSNESSDGFTKQSSGSISLKSLNEKMTVSDELSKDAYKVDIVPEFEPGNAKTPTVKSTQKALVKAASVGTKKKFWTMNVMTEATKQIEAELKYSSAHSEIWVNNNEITAVQAKAMGDEFEKKIYPLITENFAKEPDVDRNGKVSILVYNIQDGFEGSGGYVAGYFYSQDLYQVAESNMSEVFYMDTYPTMGYSKAAYNVKKSFSTLAHEFQHMVNYNENVLIEDNPEMELWLNEAMSMAAEQMYLGAPLMDRIEYYEQSEAIANGHSLLYWDDAGDTLSNYSLSYLFGQYLRIQSGQNEKVYKELLMNTKEDEAALKEIIQKYIKADKTLGQFLTDFRYALLVNEPTGLYGFNGEPALSKIAAPLYKGTLPRTMRGGGALNVPVTDVKNVKTPADKGKSVQYRLVDGKEANRIAGTDRYATAVAISKAGWKTADTAILATGLDFPDALAGGPLAYKEGAPVLLTKPGALTELTKQELIRLKAKNVIILGSKGAVSLEVEKQLEGMELNVERIGGANRFETAAMIAERLPSQQAILAFGYNFPDVLSISPYAAKNGIPILLTRTEKLPAETKEALAGKTKSIVVGQTGAISDEVMSQVPKPVRYGGKTRYETGKKINENLAMGTGKAFAATGINFPDALAGSVLAAKQNAPILLMNGKSVPMPTRELLPKYQAFSIFGSTGAVGDPVKWEMDWVLNKP